MTLAEFIALRGTKAKRELHEKTGLRWQTIHDIARGRSTPKPETAKRISDATDGLVSVASLLGLETDDTPAAANG